MEKIGDALKRVVEDKLPDKEEDTRSRRKASVISNSNRKDIFQLLCLTPCISISRISSELSLSRPTVIWHLDVLEEREYVKSKVFFNKAVYFPTGMLKEDDSKRAISLLNDLSHNIVFKQIIKEPGSSTGELKLAMGDKICSRSVLDRLEDSGLISVLKDGRHLRYYPTSKIKELSKTERSNLKSFRASLIKRMEAEHLKPEIKEIKGRGLVITINIGNAQERLEIPYHPIERALV